MTATTPQDAGPQGAGAARGGEASAKRRFHVTLIKPSHYDKDGYVIQWWKAWIPSNSLAAPYGLTQDLQERRVLGEAVELAIDAYDEMNIVIPYNKIIARHRQAAAEGDGERGRDGGGGLVCLVGVQSNQYPRALAIARRFRAAGLQVAIGGFHVSGCLSMLPGMQGRRRGDTCGCGKIRLQELSSCAFFATR